MPMVETLRHYTQDEYLALEERALNRSEYRQGSIVMMAAATYDHCAISGNIACLLRAALRGTPCRPSGGTLRICVPNRSFYTYADAMVICGTPQFASPKRTDVLNPSVIFEVLSDDAGYDRGEKFFNYQTIASLQEYVLVDQIRPRVEVFHRSTPKQWQYTVWDGLDALAPLRSLDVDLPLAAVYEGVAL